MDVYTGRCKVRPREEAGNKRDEEWTFSAGMTSKL